MKSRYFRLPTAATVQLFCFLLLYHYSASQKKSYVQDSDSIQQKWIKATICVESELSESQQTLSFREYVSKELFANHISFQRFGNILDSLETLKLRNRNAGTVIFLTDKGHFYLISAWHVFASYDTVKWGGKYSIDSGSVFKQFIIGDELRVDGQNNGTVESGKNIPVISSVWPETNRVEHSFKNDLVVIDLTGYTTTIQYLTKRGIVPITVADIDSIGKLLPGQPIYGIGYPDPSYVGLVPGVHQIYSQYASRGIRMPCISFGVVSHLPSLDNFIPADIFLYFGNSGGPIVSKNKLVGIDHAINSPYKSLGIAERGYYRTIYPSFSRAADIMPLLRKLQSQRNN